ncbi:hypothetical protein ASF44_30380 [Pseudorhodoferax sp. Leaf274]|nr:hypothetical protein ASF44_30380 [Pseudorhodoferax sp. Leaf274]
MTVLALAARAVRQLLENSGLVASDVDAVLFCHTNPTSVLAAPASIPSELKRQFGLKRAVGFSISQQNCASIVCALQLLRSLFWRNPAWQNVLIVSADKSFLESWRGLGTYAIQSDGALALWVRRGHGHNRVHHIVTRTESIYYQGAAKSAQLGQRLAMNYPVIAHGLIERVVRESGWSMEQVGAVLPMNANLSALQRVIELLGIPPDRMFTRNVGAVGHVFACDPFINFIDRFAATAEKSADKAVLYFSSSSGSFAGLSIADVRGFAAAAS